MNTFQTFSIPSFNRDRGGANHEKGDVEVDGMWLGCKRRSRVPRWMLPEKTEVGVVSRGDRLEAILSLPLRPLAELMGLAKEKGIDVSEIFERHRLGTGTTQQTKELPSSNKKD